MVDLIIDDKVAVEIKAKASTSADDLKGLNAIAEEYTFQRLICVTLEKRPRKVGVIEIMPYQNFLRALWDGALAQDGGPVAS